VQKKQDNTFTAPPRRDNLEETNSLLDELGHETADLVSWIVGGSGKLLPCRDGSEVQSTTTPAAKSTATSFYSQKL
jgi:hypothetical protein